MFSDKTNQPVSCTILYTKKTMYIWTRDPKWSLYEEPRCHQIVRTNLHAFLLLELSCNFLFFYFSVFRFLMKPMINLPRCLWSVSCKIGTTVRLQTALLNQIIPERYPFWVSIPVWIMCSSITDQLHPIDYQKSAESEPPRGQQQLFWIPENHKLCSWFDCLCGTSNTFITLATTKFAQQ